MRPSPATWPLPNKTNFANCYIITIQNYIGSVSSTIQQNWQTDRNSAFYSQITSLKKELYWKINQKNFINCDPCNLTAGFAKFYSNCDWQHDVLESKRTLLNNHRFVIVSSCQSHRYLTINFSIFFYQITWKIENWKVLLTKPSIASHRVTIVVIYTQKFD